MSKSKYITLFILMLAPFWGLAQSSKVSLDGYVKDLYMFYSPSVAIPGTDAKYLGLDFIHNRLNFKWYTTSKLTTVVEMRNRFFFGNMIKDFPEYQSSVNVDNGLVNMSWITAQGSGWFLHSIVDRAYVDYTSGKWEVRAGRQRVNWGVNLVWNPNDIFNTFSYFDFDYEERPGTDAVRVMYYPGTTTSAELVYKPAHDSVPQSLAGLYHFSKWDYDFQFLTGQAGDDWVFGGGWSGDIYGAGFRGEISHFEPLKSFSKRVTVASISADYTFKNSLYLHSSVLYTSNGTTGKAGGMDLLLNPQLSAKQLSLARWSLFGQVSMPITPLFTGSVSGIVNPSDGSWYFGPALTYSLSNNLELMLTGQLFFGSSGTEFGDIGELAFGRLKWSF